MLEILGSVHLEAPMMTNEAKFERFLSDFERFLATFEPDLRKLSAVLQATVVNILYIGGQWLAALQMLTIC